MKAVRFHTQIGSDRTIRIPEGAEVADGQAEVIVLQPDVLPEGNGAQPEKPKEHLVDKLARLAQELNIDPEAFPRDLAENHDHYAHGAPRGLDKR